MESRRQLEDAGEFYPMDRDRGSEKLDEEQVVGSPSDKGEPCPRSRWQESSGWGFTLIAGYLLLASLPVILALALRPSSQEPFLEEMGKACGLMGFVLLTLQVVLAGRLRVVERPFGLDIVMHFHKAMGIVTGILLMCHPIFMVLAKRDFWLFSFETPWQIDLGKIALSVLLLSILFALIFKKLRIKYQVWRFLHKATIAAVVLGFIHGIVIGPDLRPLGMRVYWWVLFVIAISIFIYRNIVVPLWSRQRFRVISVLPETHNTFTLTLEPVDGPQLRHYPGQFMFLKLRRPGRTSEEHPFTVSSSPTQRGVITATIKQSGDFTNTIDQTIPGDVALVEAPFGRFSFVHHNAASLLFIAGGVGITPIMSMLRYLRDKEDRRPAVLIYGNRTQQDIIFRNELTRLPDNVKVVHVLSEPEEDWQGPRGYVTAEIIKEHGGPILDNGHVYLCGPLTMMDKIIDALRTLGVDEKRIHYERFAI
jgi:predicted ferric reductase